MVGIPLRFMRVVWVPFLVDAGRFLSWVFPLEEMAPDALDAEDKADFKV